MLMKRFGVKGKSKPAYPDVDEVNRDRRAFLLRLGGSVLGLSVFGLAGCDLGRTGGEPMPPAAPSGGTGPAPSMGPKPGSNAPVVPGQAPVAAEPQDMLDGDMPVPKDPTPKPIPVPPRPEIHMKGDVAEPPMPPIKPVTPPVEEKDVVEEGDTKEVPPNLREIRTPGVPRPIAPPELPQPVPDTNQK